MLSQVVNFGSPKADDFGTFSAKSRLFAPPDANSAPPKNQKPGTCFFSVTSTNTSPAPRPGLPDFAGVIALLLLQTSPTIVASRLQGGSRENPAPCKIDPYRPFLRERWETGVHNARKLLDELRLRGYDGGYSQQTLSLI